MLPFCNQWAIQAALKLLMLLYDGPVVGMGLVDAEGDENNGAKQKSWEVGRIVYSCQYMI